MTDKTRHAHLLVVTSSLFIVAAIIGATGCDHVIDDCTLAHTCPSEASAGDGGAGGSAGTGGGGASTGDGGAGGNCDPTISPGFNNVDVSCGVYVWSKAIGPYSGTSDEPFSNLAAALSTVAGRTDPKLRNVYACNDGTFTEPVILSGDVTLWGGLNCKDLNWLYEANAKTKLTALAGAIPLTVNPTVDATVHDFAITADLATTSGGSSIAVVVDSATATFTNCVLSAGDASDGAPGVSGGMQASQADSGKQGDDAGPNPTSGGTGGTNTCDTKDPGVPAKLTGGAGGGGGAVMSAPGGGGSQGDMDNIDKGGVGGHGGGKVDCSAGQDGSGGTTPVNDPPKSGIGVINAFGYHGANGTDGSNGSHGTSGGGGGGSMAAATKTNGAAGGGGGAGGCGGKLGTKGEAGGSSIALMGLKATVTMNSCTLSAGKGGNGGAGGGGQPGQQGGTGGIGGMGSAPVLPGCDGGKGGKGGDGGNGGGGSGGHSLGIAMAGGMLTYTMLMSTFQPDASKGGPGGNKNVSGNKGTDGRSMLCLDFEGTQDSNACPPPGVPPK